MKALKCWDLNANIQSEKPFCNKIENGAATDASAHCIEHELPK